MMRAERRNAGDGFRQRGWGMTEYLAVLMGLIVVWRGAQALLALIREHHDEFSWALMIPF